MVPMRNVTAWVSLWVYLLFGTGVSANLVLCRGADGHVALEFACGDAGDHCGSCVDLLVRAAGAQEVIAPVPTRPVRDLDQRPPAVWPAPPIALADARLSGRDHSPPCPAASAPGLESVRTVVLLI